MSIPHCSLSCCCFGCRRVFGTASLAVFFFGTASLAVFRPISCIMDRVSTHVCGICSTCGLAALRYRCNRCCSIVCLLRILSSRAEAFLLSTSLPLSVWNARQEALAIDFGLGGFVVRQDESHIEGLGMSDVKYDKVLGQVCVCVRERERSPDHLGMSDAKYDKVLGQVCVCVRERDHQITWE